MALTVISWGKTRHLEQVNGTTVCGITIAKIITLEPERAPLTPGTVVCKSCERMKDATTMRLKPWSGK